MGCGHLVGIGVTNETQCSRGQSPVRIGLGEAVMWGPQIPFLSVMETRENGAVITEAIGVKEGKRWENVCDAREI